MKKSLLISIKKNNFLTDLFAVISILSIIGLFALPFLGLIALAFLNVILLIDDHWRKNF